MSEVKVNKISPRTDCGTTTLGDSGDTFNIPCGSKINVASGGNITVASGATITNNGTQSGFGREGSVDWQTGSIKTGTFTAATGEGYFVNTSGGISTVNLPAGAAGSIVALSDYTRTFNSNNCTVTPNGSEKIGGGDAGASVTLSVNGQSATFVYVDGTEGWINVQETQTSQAGSTSLFVTATGGATPAGEIVCTNYKVHTFTGPGTFCVSCAGNACGSNTIDYLVVAGGGGGTMEFAGGGAGGYRESPGTASGCYTTSPLGAAPAVALPVTATGYPVAIGAGGGGGTLSTSPTGSGVKGSDSVFTGSSTITSTGGGNGIKNCSGQPGGSGAGGSAESAKTGGTGNSPPTNPAQGTPGGVNTNSGPGSRGGGGGGGATVAGGCGDGCSAGAGGAGAGTAINPSPSYGTPGPSGPLRYFAGGGAGGEGIPSGVVPGGVGGGGANAGGCGTTNTGGGGGAFNRPTGCGGAGGSGIVIIRYKFQ